VIDEEVPKGNTQNGANEDNHRVPNGTIALDLSEEEGKLV